MCDTAALASGVIRNLFHFPTNGFYTSRKFINHNQNFNTLFWRFDLVTRSSAEKAGTQFFQVKTRKNWVPASSDKDLMTRLKRQDKVLKFWLWFMNFLLVLIYQSNEFISREMAFKLTRSTSNSLRAKNGKDILPTDNL